VPPLGDGEGLHAEDLRRGQEKGGYSGDGQESFLDGLDQSPEFDPAEPEPIPDHASPGAQDFHQSWEA
jgi:hypothetical protein